MLATPKKKGSVHCRDLDVVPVQAVIWVAIKMDNKQCAGCKQTSLPYTDT